MSLITPNGEFDALYFDTSAINWLTDDSSRSILLTALSRTTCSISIFTVAELASTSDDKRRIELLSVAKQLTGDSRPLTMPGEILTRATDAFMNNIGQMNASIDQNWEGVWNALCNPASIDKKALFEVQNWKHVQEDGYQNMHDRARPHIQSELSKLSQNEKAWLTAYPSRLLKRFSRNREFLLDVISDLFPPTLTFSKEVAGGMIDNLDCWRFYLAGMTYGMYCRSLQPQAYGKKSNPGSIDTQQAIYLVPFLRSFLVFVPVAKVVSDGFVEFFV